MALFKKFGFADPNVQAQYALLAQEEKKRRLAKIMSIDRFAGSLDEYIQFKQEQGKLVGDERLVIMDNGFPVKQVTDVLLYNLEEGGYGWREVGEESSNLQNILIGLIDKGCIGLIRYSPVSRHVPTSIYASCTGMPVKVKTPEIQTYRKNNR